MNELNLRNITVLDAEEEYQLAVRYYEHKDVEAAKKLTLGHLRFVAHVAYKYKNYGLSEADLFQEGCIGLMKAVKNFNPYKNVKLITFAAYWIRAEIHEYILKNWRLVKIATTKSQRKLFFSLRRQLELTKQNTLYNPMAIAKKLRVKEKDVIEMTHRLSSPEFSLDQEDSDESIMILQDHVEEDPAEKYAQSHDKNIYGFLLKKAMEKLDKRSLHIMQHRFLTEEKSTLQELSSYHHISIERVRQLENQALAKLKSFLPARA